MEGADNIETIIGGDGDVNGDSSTNRHQGTIISHKVSATSTSRITDGDEEEDKDYLGGVDSASHDECRAHVPMTKKGLEIIEEEEEEEEEETTAGDDQRDDDVIRTASTYYYGQLHCNSSNSNNFHNNSSSINLYTNSSNPKRSSSEIVAAEDEDEDEDGGSGLFSVDLHNQGNSSDEDVDAVHVAVSSSSTSSSMDALLWTLKHSIVNPSSTTVFLVHVFPEIKHIPTPLGMMAVSQVNPEQKEKYMAQEREKRRELLNKFLNACSTAKVKADTILIESDTEAKAILDLIPILNITKLVLGTTKANLRKMRSRKGSGLVVDQITKAAPEFCEVNIICEGKEVLDLLLHSPSTRPYISTPPQSSAPPAHIHSRVATQDSFGCSGCFKPKFRS